MILPSTRCQTAWMVINVMAQWLLPTPHYGLSQNQNPFQTFTGLWRSLPRAAKALLLWAALQSAVTIAYASAIFATPQASQEFVFPLLVRQALLSYARTT